MVGFETSQTPKNILENFLSTVGGNLFIVMVYLN